MTNTTMPTTTPDTTIVGALVLDEPVTLSVPQEFAGAVRQIRVEPGRYDIVLRRDTYGKTYKVAFLPGICTLDAWFGSNVRVEHPNTPDVYRLSIEDWNVSFQALRHGKGKFAIARDEDRVIFAHITL